MPTRTTAHVIDTKAVRLIMSTLNANWLFRSLDERDYGVDLSLEKFDNDEPTGQYVFIQVKGHDKKLIPQKGFIKFKFPVDTLKYAELFKEPFFALVVSLANKKIFFISLKHYINVLDLGSNHKNWRNQKFVNLDIPVENDFGKNFAKFEEMIEIDYRQMRVFSAMQCFYELLFYFNSWRGLRNGNILLNEIEKFLYLVEKTDEQAVNDTLMGTTIAPNFNPSAIRFSISMLKKKGRITIKDINDLKSQVCQVTGSIFQLSAMNCDPINGKFPY